jgi:tetratricopeptide (TPR) repeat protein
LSGAIFAVLACAAAVKAPELPNKEITVTENKTSHITISWEPPKDDAQGKKYYYKVLCKSGSPLTEKDIAEDVESQLVLLHVLALWSESINTATVKVLSHGEKYFFMVFVKCEGSPVARYNEQSVVSLPVDGTISEDELDNNPALRILFDYGLYKPDMTAKDYNAAGFSLYEMKKYEEAARLFQAAAGKDDQYVLAHYNLACTVGLLLREGKKIEDYHDRFALDELGYAIHLDPALREKAGTDRDLEALWNMDEFKALTADPDNPYTVTKVFTFKNVSSLEGDVSLIFTDENGKECYFDAAGKGFDQFDFYTVKAGEIGPPDVTFNPQMVGKRFRIEYGWAMGSNRREPRMYADQTDKHGLRKG